MSGNEHLQLGDIAKKKEAMNKTGGLNTQKAVFNTEKEENSSSSGDYMVPGFNNSYMNRVEQLANYGTVSGNNRSLIQNSVDLGHRQQMKDSAGETMAVQSEEKRGVLRARPDLKVFSGDVMEKGVFTPKAKEASRHFLAQLTEWAGGFDQKDASFYKSMGISGILDCIYVDGMSLKNFVSEQYFYKKTGSHAEDQLMLQNYVALIAARGEHVITLARPNVKGDEAEVEFKNLEMDLTEVGAAEAGNAKRLKERGNQVRSTLKKRMESDLTEQTGRAFRKDRGYNMDGFNRLEGAKDGLKEAGDGSAKQTPEYKEFDRHFEKYSGGLQKLGLKPGRDDINKPVAEELKKRCEKALEAANYFLANDIEDQKTKKAVEEAKKQLETDLKLLTDAIETKLIEEGARMSLEDLLDSRVLDPDNDKDNNNDNDSDDNDTET